MIQRDIDRIAIKAWYMLEANQDDKAADYIEEACPSAGDYQDNPVWKKIWAWEEAGYGN